MINQSDVIRYPLGQMIQFTYYLGHGLMALEPEYLKMTRRRPRKIQSEMDFYDRLSGFWDFLKNCGGNTTIGVLDQYCYSCSLWAYKDCSEFWPNMFKKLFIVTFLRDQAEMDPLGSSGLLITCKCCISTTPQRSAASGRLEAELKIIVFTLLQ